MVHTVRHHEASFFSLSGLAENTKNVALYFSHLVYVIVLRYFIGVGDPKKIAQIFADTFHSSDIEERGWKLSFLQNREIKRLSFREHETLTSLAHWFFSLKHAESISSDPEKRHVINQKAQELGQMLSRKAESETQELDTLITNCEAKIQQAEKEKENEIDSRMKNASNYKESKSLELLTLCQKLTEDADTTATQKLTEAQTSLEFIRRTRSTLEGMTKELAGIDQTSENREHFEETLAKVRTIEERVLAHITKLDEQKQQAKKWNEQSKKDFIRLSLRLDRDYDVACRKISRTKQQIHNVLHLNQQLDINPLSLLK